MTNWSLFQERKACSVFEKSSNVTYYPVNRRKKKNHTIISIHAEKASDKIQHNRNSQKNRTREELPQLDEKHLEKTCHSNYN